MRNISFAAPVYWYKASRLIARLGIFKKLNLERLLFTYKSKNTTTPPKQPQPYNLKIRIVNSMAYINHPTENFEEIWNGFRTAIQRVFIQFLSKSILIVTIWFYRSIVLFGLMAICTVLLWMVVVLLHFRWHVL